MRALSMTLLTTLATLATTMAIHEASAQTRREWKWCLHASGIRSCTFPTFEQCNKGRRGKGGHCERNPRYVGR